MTPSQRESLKDDIVNIVKRNGIALRRQNVAEYVAMPDGADLGELLDELVAEGRLTKSYTLLVNGERGSLYNVTPTR